MTFQALLHEAMRLPPHQRSDLAEQLLESLAPADAADWERTWTDELRQRLANDDGQRFDLGQTVADLRERLGHRG